MKRRTAERITRDDIADGLDEWEQRWIFCECSMCWPIDDGPSRSAAQCGGES